MTDAVSTGESTVNPDCAVRNRDKHLQTHLENCRLKGQIQEKEAETAALRDKVEVLAANMAALMSRLGGTPEELQRNSREGSWKSQGGTASWIHQPRLGTALWLPASPASGSLRLQRRQEMRQRTVQARNRHASRQVNESVMTTWGRLQRQSTERLR